MRRGCPRRCGCARRCGYARRCGFTLVELLVVLAILGITAAVTAPALGRFLEPARSATPADGLAALLREARSAALAQARPAVLTLDPETGRYWLEADTVVEGRIEGAAASGRGRVTSSRAGTASGRGRMSSSRQPVPLRVRIVFRPDGTASGGPAFLETAAGRVSVGVDPWTGAIRVAAP